MQCTHRSIGQPQVPQRAPACRPCARGISLHTNTDTHERMCLRAREHRLLENRLCPLLLREHRCPPRAASLPACASSALPRASAVAGRCTGAVEPRVQLASPPLLNEPLTALASVRCGRGRGRGRPEWSAPSHPKLSDEPSQLCAFLPAVAHVSATGTAGLHLVVLRLCLALWQCGEPLIISHGCAARTSIGVDVEACRCIGRWPGWVQGPLVQRLGGAVLSLSILQPERPAQHGSTRECGYASP